MSLVFENICDYSVIKVAIKWKVLNVVPIFVGGNIMCENAKWCKGNEILWINRYTKNTICN